MSLRILLLEDTDDDADLMMPTMDGIALVRALRQKSPEVKIIVTAGA